mmetsp:Transcript_6514/g.16942  ORF Transcript_6514/g.16942 Transcript_6514/m.16942 type:complete len:147 (+) Transcript_6514:170-610(+)
MVQHVLITYADNKAILREEGAFKASPLLYAARDKARRVRVRLYVRLSDVRAVLWRSRIGVRVGNAMERRVRPALLLLWLRWMRVTRRALPRDVARALSIAELKAEASLRGLEIAHCVERTEIEQLMCEPLHRQARDARSDDVDMAV